MCSSSWGGIGDGEGASPTVGQYKVQILAGQELQSLFFRQLQIDPHYIVGQGFGPYHLTGEAADLYLLLRFHFMYLHGQIADRHRLAGKAVLVRPCLYRRRNLLIRIVHLAAEQITRAAATETIAAPVREHHALTLGRVKDRFSGLTGKLMATGLYCDLKTHGNRGLFWKQPGILYYFAEDLKLIVNRLIIGCGYLGRRVAAHYLDRGDRVCGLVRSESSRRELIRMGISCLALDIDTAPLRGLYPGGTRLFYFLPPPGEGETDPRIRYLRTACEADEHPRRILYLSTTGVYGDCKGETVDETRPVNPVALRARRRWDAEQRFRAWRATADFELIILRVAGIYGPGRLPLERIRRQLPLIRPEEAPWTNRIHVDDLARVCVAAMEKGRDGEVYNVSDGSPGTMTDYFNRIADMAGLPRPPLISMGEGDQQLSPGMMSYMRESRRLDNRKMLEEFGVELRYPNLEAGLTAC